jgi:hypothetical protein
MNALLRQGAWLLLAAWLSWWVLLRAPARTDQPRTLPVPAAVMELTPVVAERADVSAAQLVASLPALPVQPVLPAPVEEDAAPAARAAEEAAAEEDGEEEGGALSLPERVPPVAASEPASAPPPPSAGGAEQLAEEPRLAAAAVEALVPQMESQPASQEPAAGSWSLPERELGAPEGERASAASSEPFGAPEEAAPAEEQIVPARAGETIPRRVPAPGSVESLMRDPTLVAEAREEFERGQAKGFTTVLLATPEDQLAIARFFGEELVLVPRRALDPRNPSPAYFHLTNAGEPRVEEVKGAAPLQRYHQYRDLFDYEYGRLPTPLRELRRTVLGRGEVYLFAALLSAEEWALIIARRRTALESAERALDEVRRFVLRYLRLPGGGFDLAVEEIVFADGTRYRPAARGLGG